MKLCRAITSLPRKILPDGHVKQCLFWAQWPRWTIIIPATPWVVDIDEPCFRNNNNKDSFFYFSFLAAALFCFFVFPMIWPLLQIGSHSRVSKYFSQKKKKGKERKKKIFFESLLCLNFILSLGSDRSENIDESKIVFKLSENSKSVQMKKKKLNLCPFQIQIEARQWFCCQRFVQWGHHHPCLLRTLWSSCWWKF